MAIDGTDPGKTGPNEVPQQTAGYSELTGWVMGRVNRWRAVRNANYLRMWDDYYQVWRGVWTAQQQNREIERSRLIAPATQQAVDATIAEMTEATFGRGMWFDLDDTTDESKLAQAQQCRVNLLNDFQRDKLKHAIIETYSSGCIYGTGIAKRIVDESDATSLVSDEFGGLREETEQVKKVYWESVPPHAFVVDTTAKNIDEALGAAHETVRPYHEIKLKQAAGEFFKGTIGTMSGYNMALVLRGPRGESLEIDPEDGVYITEYHGLVPTKMLESVSGDTDDDGDNPLAGMELEDPNNVKADDDDTYTEAIVTIANGGTLLKAVKNPFGGDRGFVAYPHDKVPNRFWGRGVCEKAWNSQKALDAQLRARIDALALMTYPVMGADATRLPRNLNLQITPGKTIFTNGAPNEVIQPLMFGNMDPASFQQSGDLERMVQMATGALDMASPMSPGGGGNETAAGASMSSGSMIKRAKLTMQNVDSYFLQPLVNKTLRAYRVIDPQRYPVDVTFRVNTTMSVMAREYEQSQMTNLLAIIPPQTPAFFVVLQALAENYSGPSKDKLISAIQQMQQPDPKAQQMQEQLQTLQIKQLAATVENLGKEAGKLDAEVRLLLAKASKEDASIHLETDKVHNSTAQTAIMAHKNNLMSRQLDIEEQRLPIERMKAQNAGKSTESK